MPTDHIVALLIAERDKLNAAIEALQGTGKRIGRPPKKRVASELTTEPATAAPKKRHVSAAARKKMAAAQKKRWAAVKAAK
jgi:hypothetical protein